MDHTEAIRLQAAEKYILGELLPEIREAYEEHYFECEECANDIMAAAIFAGGARALFQKESNLGNAERQGTRGWFGWLRPAIALPALATLLLIASYQAFVTIPRLQHSVANAGGAQNADFLSLISANSRSEGATIFPVHPDRPAVLELDIQLPAESRSYLCQIRDSSGHTIFESHISSSEAKSSVYLVLPKGALKKGKYAAVILNDGSSPAGRGALTELSQFTFSVETVP